MDLIRVPTFNEWISSMLELLIATAQWLLTSWFGPTILVLFVMLYTVPFLARLGGPDPLFDASPWED